MSLNEASFAKKLKVSESQLQRTLNDLPVTVGKLLGCGNIGCTFMGEPGTVVKITADKSEVDLWNMVVELDEKGIDLSAGIPEVYAIGELPDIGAYWVHREEVEPLVLGSRMALSKRTKQYLFGQKIPSAELTLGGDWSFVALLEGMKSFKVPASAWPKAELLDEDLNKLYVLTDLESFAENQPSIMEEVWLKAYIEASMSERGPLRGIGDAVATIVSETGTLWITDIHLGNVGWRLRGSKPQLLVYDWLTAELIPNGCGCG